MATQERLPTGRLPSVTGSVGIIGLGYVGLQLAVHFGEILPTIGFDIDAGHVKALQDGEDRTREVSSARLKAAGHLTLTSRQADLTGAGVLIIAVPTPVDSTRRPDLGPLLYASEIAGAILVAHRRAEEELPPIVVYESTVYPGCTEDVCIPVLERVSGLVAGQDFKVGYSPERINPGDPEHTLDRIVKIVSGQDAATVERLAALYGSIVRAGIYRVPDIRTAEAAKVIENVQRDLNIALMNELAVLFHRLGLDTQEVLRAARTKWNFLPFEPGLVGGHCIPVDPYYLTHKAQEVGYIPDVILAGRRTNDSMGAYIGRETIRLLISAGRIIRRTSVLILGFTFKENVTDTRNTRVLDIATELRAHEIDVSIHDPLANGEDVRRLGFVWTDDPFADTARYDGIILAVPHHAFRDRTSAEYLRLLRNDGFAGVLVDLKGVLADLRGSGHVLYWTL